MKGWGAPCRLSGLPWSLPNKKPVEALLYDGFKIKTDTLILCSKTLLCPNSSYFFPTLKKVKQCGGAPKGLMGPGPEPTSVPQAEPEVTDYSIPSAWESCERFCSLVGSPCLPQRKWICRMVSCSLSRAGGVSACRPVSALPWARPSEHGQEGRGTRVTAHVVLCTYCSLNGRSNPPDIGTAPCGQS